jgi:hypothetical protein
MLVMTKDKRNMEQIQWKKGISYTMLCYDTLYANELKVLLLVLANKVSGHTIY